jgi:vacuolar-type H+-ATPase subunit E/Vma4
MSKNKKVMSIAIQPELQEELKKVSKRKGMSSSTYISNLVEQAMKLNPDDDPIVVSKPSDEDVIPVVLKIPTNLKSDKEKLKNWLEVQSNGILNAMTKNSN